MTSNQIAYHQMKNAQRATEEQIRSNKAKEVETNRHNLVDEYNKLLRAVNNPLSLIAHFADGSADIPQGLDNMIKNLVPNQWEQDFIDFVKTPVTVTTTQNQVNTGVEGAIKGLSSAAANQSSSESIFVS